MMRSDGTKGRRRADAAALAAISPLPPAEEVFVDWLLSVPHGDCIEAAARRQIWLIDRSQARHPGLSCLRTLLTAIAGDADWPRPMCNL